MNYHELRAIQIDDGACIELGDRDGRWLIGRRPDAAIQLDDRCPIPVLATLERKGGVLWLAAADDGYPITRRNGEPDGVNTLACVVAVGDQFTLANITFTVLACAGSLPRLLGRSPAFVNAVAFAKQAAATECSVLLLGETGTGKEMIANCIHAHSRRRTGPYVAINCGALPKELISTELFGHAKGAFTGADAARDGVFMQAQGGTLFLDEIGELPMEQQTHLLRVLETRRVRPVGANRDYPFDVRIIAATHRAAGLGTVDGALRVDVYHRIANAVVELPPLRERHGDIKLIIEAGLAEAAARGVSKSVALAAWEPLQRYSWPGNVRELRHAINRAIHFGGDLLTFDDFLPVRQRLARASEPPPLPVAVDDIMRDAIGSAIGRYGSIRKAAKHLGIPKSTLADRVKQYGIAPRNKRPG